MENSITITIPFNKIPLDKIEKHVLEDLLEMVLSAEQYEFAAKVRDAINKRKNNNP